MSRALVLLLGIVALATGCGRGAIEAPKAAPRAGVHQTEAPRRIERPRPHLIAPPPAYGNKVVMARASGATASN